jgi:hypothetical protein
MAARQRSDFRCSDRTGPKATLGSAQFVVLLTGLGLVLTVVAIAVYPDAYRQYVQDVGIKRFERQYGFRSGLVTWRKSGRDVESMWGIVSVTSDGAFARAGVRKGDVPWSAHDRVVELYSALEQASAGRATSLEMFNPADAHLGAGAHRTITLLPSRTSSP